MNNFAFALAILWPEEGLLSNNPADHGGRTMYGLTQGVYDKWQDTIHEPRGDVALVSKEKVKAIYLAWYWMPAHCDALPKRLACMTFDTCINSGPKEAIQLLQRALGIDADGLWGANTDHAVVLIGDSVDEDKVISAYASARITFMLLLGVKDPTQEVFEKGWGNRVKNLETKLLNAQAS